MALIHETLYRSSDLARIDFTDYVSRLLESICSAFGVERSRIATSVEGGDLTLNINAVVGCGLPMNKVLSHSLKYAFPDGRHGEIRVGLSVGEDGQFHLALADNSVGLPSNFELRARSSLVTRLIEWLVSQLNGSLDRKSSETGTKYRIVFSGEL